MNARERLPLGDRLMLPLLVALFGLTVLLDEVREVGSKRCLAGWRLRRAQRRVRKAHALIAEERRVHREALGMLHAELQAAVDKLHALDDLAEGRVS